LVTETPAPRRIDCHYVITAWSPVIVTDSVEPTLDEHTLLYQVMAVLMQNAPLNPSRIYHPGTTPLNSVPEIIRNADLPTQVLPPEGFPKLAEFWGAMGAGDCWKPVIYLIVTLPVILRAEIAGPMVTTRITEYRQMNQPETAEVWIQIGGHVWGAGAARSVAVGRATVTHVDGAGTSVTVDDPSPFQEGDVVTEDESARPTITRVQGNVLTLSAPLADGDTLRLANIESGQSRFRMTDVAGLESGGAALLIGRDADNPATIVTQRVTVRAVDTNTCFVTLNPTPVRIRDINLDVLPASAPALQPLTAQVGAWVQLEDDTGAALQTETDADGRFTFGQLHTGNYNLRVRARGLTEFEQNVQVPSPAGNYDVILV
jgi:hypothetical protein